MALAGRKRGRLKTVPCRIQRRMGTLNQAWPDRNSRIAVILPLPGERLWVGQRSDYQERSLLRHSTCLIQIDRESAQFVWYAAQEEQQQTPTAQDIEHSYLLGNMNGIVQGQNRSEQSDFRPPDALHRRCGEDGGIGSGYQQGGVVMFRKADPVKAKFIRKCRLLKHLLHHSKSKLWLKKTRRRRPACFIHCSDAIGCRWQEGSFHSNTLFQHKTGSK